MGARSLSGRPDRIRIWRASVTKWQLKVLLTVFGLSIIGSVLYYTKNIVDELVASEIRSIKLYVKIIERAYMGTADEDLLFYVDLARTSITFPVIITDKSGDPVYPYSQFMMNVDMDSTLTVAEQRTWLVSYLSELQSEYPPILIEGPDGQVIQRVYYTNSAIVRRLRFMPYVEIMIVASFILVGYVAFSTIRRNEESNIWVGMAKEAAHQMGTPLSSLLAWLEILRLERADPNRVEQTSHEMQRDVERLNVIANRFAKIGAQPKFEHTEVAPVVERVCGYFETRLPNLGKRVSLERILDDTCKADVSVELFEWVIENLIKNAVEAIERPDGRITIRVEPGTKGGTTVIVRDNGKGMTRQVASRIFQPGYTTKRRGWGLGLSLSRRIIEDYHRGRLVVHETHVGAGTTFKIDLPSNVNAS